MNDATSPSRESTNAPTTLPTEREEYVRPAILKRHSVQRVTLFSGAGVASVSSLTGH